MSPGWYRGALGLGAFFAFPRLRGISSREVAVSWALRGRRWRSVDEGSSITDGRGRGGERRAAAWPRGGAWKRKNARQTHRRRVSAFIAPGRKVLARSFHVPGGCRGARARGGARRRRGLRSQEVTMMQLSPDRRRSWSVPISARFGACLVAVAALGAYGCDVELLGDAGDPKQSEPGAPAQEEPQSGSGEPPGVDGVGWMTRLPRLSHAQWENTVRDLLRLDAAPGLSATFSLDPDDKTFDTFTARTVSANLWNDYQRAAETLAARVTGDPAALQRILPAAAPEDAATFVAELGLR